MTRTKRVKGHYSFCSARFLRFALLVAGGIAGMIHTEAQVLSISVGSQTINPAPNQTLTFTVNNSSPSAVDVAGLNFNIQLGDGTVGPTITGVDLLTGTPFASNNTGQTDNSSGAHQAFWTVTTSSGAVSLSPGSTKVATVTFDGTSLTSGQNWGLFLEATHNGPTRYLDTTVNANDIPMTITDGSLTIVPEPSTYALISGVGCLAFAAAFRRARGRQ
jgi:hypothetical protein